ncbi:hypothetical protein [Streptomyces sp. C36]|uniref:hypothetical protein n=1 Tax=Streptomyces sp. C36 TaxID=3237122 RepID=UPI0034C67A1F
MTEWTMLEAVREDGSIESVRVCSSDTPPYGLRVAREGRPEEVYSEGDLFACLLAARRDLEHGGLLLCCQGARSDVTSSGMQSQMTGGRFVYTFDTAARTVSEETVDILAPARPDEIVTVAEQRAAVFAFYGIEDHGRER